MVKVLFFASLREKLENPGVSVDFAQLLIHKDQPNIADLRDYMREHIFGKTGDILYDDKVFVAKNHQTVSLETVIDDNDEIAFFPPVTGG